MDVDELIESALIHTAYDLKRMPVYEISSESSCPTSPIHEQKNKVSEMCAGASSCNLHILSSGESDCNSKMDKKETNTSFNYHDLSSQSSSTSWAENMHHFLSSSGEEVELLQVKSDECCSKTVSRRIKYTDLMPDKTNLSKDERQVLKELKEKEKLMKAQLAEKQRRLKPGECMKYMVVVIDQELAKSEICALALELEKTEDFKINVFPMREPNSITWLRKLGNDTPEVEEKHIMIVWNCDKLISAVKDGNLIETFETLQSDYCGYQIAFAIHGVGNYYRKLNNIKRRKARAEIMKNMGTIIKDFPRRKVGELISQQEIEASLTELEIRLGISHRLIDNQQNFALFLKQVTKAIAESPHKLEVQKRDDEKTWFVRGNSRDCVRVDKDLNGLSRLWLQQLCQFNQVRLDTAKAIVKIYPTPNSLFEAYEKCSTRKEKETLLQDIQIKRTAEPCTTKRRVGPELSKKICLVFSQSDGDVLLSQN